MNRKYMKPITPFTSQPAHLAGLIGLLLLLTLYIQQQNADYRWGVLALITALAHQGLVAAVWRYTLFTPLPEGLKLKRRIRFFAVFFALFMASRLAVTLAASWSSEGSLLLPEALQ